MFNCKSGKWQPGVGSGLFIFLRLCAALHACEGPQSPNLEESLSLSISAPVFCIKDIFTISAFAVTC